VNESKLYSSEQAVFIVEYYLLKTGSFKDYKNAVVNKFFNDKVQVCQQ
jgi:hypothetical protein